YLQHRCQHPEVLLRPLARRYAGLQRQRRQSPTETPYRVGSSSPTSTLSDGVTIACASNSCRLPENKPSRFAAKNANLYMWTIDKSCMNCWKVAPFVVRSHCKKSRGVALTSKSVPSSRDT